MVIISIVIFRPKMLFHPTGRTGNFLIPFLTLIRRWILIHITSETTFFVSPHPEVFLGNVCKSLLSESSHISEILDHKGTSYVVSNLTLDTSINFILDSTLEKTSISLTH